MYFACPTFIIFTKKGYKYTSKANLKKEGVRDRGIDTYEEQ
jgi:hypothetical protein